MAEDNTKLENLIEKLAVSVVNGFSSMDKRFDMVDQRFNDIESDLKSFKTDDASATDKYPSVKAIKDYTDGLVTGLLNYRGAYDASTNQYPTITQTRF